MANDREVASFGRIRLVSILLSGVPWGGWSLAEERGGRTSVGGASGTELLVAFCTVAVFLKENCGGRAVDRGIGVGRESCTVA